MKYCLILLISISFFTSCKKRCLNKINETSSFPIEILNRQDTISLNDSIVFEIALLSETIDANSGMMYDWKDLEMVFSPRAAYIDDSLTNNKPISNIISLDVNPYFDYKIKKGQFSSINNGLKPLSSNDSIFVEYVVYPKQSGLFSIINPFEIPDHKYYNQDQVQGIILAEKDECTLLMINLYFLITEPINSLVSENANNFDMYYNSDVFNSGSLDKNDVLGLRKTNRYRYFVYVE